jgi:ADP-heptose:LPS heptosyltransferase
MNVLIIKLGALGDMIQAMPMFEAIHTHLIKNHQGDRNTKQKLILLTTKPFAALAERLGLFDHIICDDRSSLKANLSMLHTLRQQTFGSIFDLQDVDRTRVYRFLLWGKYQKWLTAPRTKHRNTEHPYLRFNALCATQKWPDIAPPNGTCLMEPLTFPLPPTPYMLIIAGSSDAHGGHKRWSQKKYATICHRLLNNGITPVLIGGNNDRLDDLTHALAQTNAVNLIGKTSLFQITTLATQAVGALGNDTGPQLIAATGCPTLTLYSSVNPPEKGGASAWDKARHHALYVDHLADLSAETVWDTLLEKIM